MGPERTHMRETTRIQHGPNRTTTLTLKFYIAQKPASIRALLVLETGTQ